MVRDADKVLAQMMGRVKEGGSSLIIDLVRMFDENINRDDNQLWEIDELVA